MIYLIYSLILTAGFLLMLPLFIARREKYAAGFLQRLGRLPAFAHDGRPVIWLHCVSVGETNAAKPLVAELLSQFPGHRIVISTTTKTGQAVARKSFGDRAAAVFYFPFDWKFSVRRALKTYEPAAVLSMETEIWPRFFRESSKSRVRIAIVNGRLSERSFRRYSRIRLMLRQTLAGVDLALMQTREDADRIVSLGAEPSRVKVTGNLKFDQHTETAETGPGSELRARFAFSDDRPLIIASSTHHPEEKWLIDSFMEIANRRGAGRPRMMIAPRHPERFDEVAGLMADSGLEWARRSSPTSESDRRCDLILLDSIGELRAVYSQADIVFVGGSLIPHGGQSVLEPAAAGRAIVTGPYTLNFDAAVREFLNNDAIVQLPNSAGESVSAELARTFDRLLDNRDRRSELAANALAVMAANRGATRRTISALKDIL